jgi:acyl-homoserine lactone acylase PvdQ
MNKLITVFILLIALPVGVTASTPRNQNADMTRWEQRARNVTIIRDNWGIAHVYGKTDADAVFGAIYAQAEDDFNRVETNYINAMGRLAEAEGETAIWRDLRMKLFINPVAIKAHYLRSPVWLKALMNAWADGLNFYLAKHPDIKPRVIRRFEPWMALTFTEGSIGGDIETINLDQLKAFYGGGPTAIASSDERELLAEPSGSNGFAISPSNTLDHKSLLLINPHTSFFFRSELQMTSAEGLNAYGAATWGQFFIYQGFNERCGWMHTSSAVDAIDRYLETIIKKGDRFYYKHGGKELPLTTSVIVVPYKTGTGMARKTFTVYRTQHGPVVLSTQGKWESISLMHEPVKALMQSYSRTKAKSYKEFKQTMELHTNSSNNTVYADADGNIAYFHGNFIPRRDTRFDWTKPVDGSDPATDWHGLLSVDETPNLLNPASGWLYNSNDSPWSAAGPSSPKKADYPAYVDSGTESARGHHAVRVLRDKKDFTVDSLIAAAYDSYLTWFEKPIPVLLKAWDQMPAANPLKAKTSEQIAALREWDLRWSEKSIATSLAVFWAEDVQRNIKRNGLAAVDYITSEAAPEQLLQSLSTASEKLAADFGTWKTPWGDINRFQRLTDDIVHPFSDAAPSIPVGFTSAVWGSLASFGARPYKGSKKIYGTSGNSFVSVIEFGKTVRAKAVTAGGESGNPSSPHFNDQAKRYSTGDLRDVYFYRSQLKGHAEREYHPGN